MGAGQTWDESEIKEQEELRNLTNTLDEMVSSLGIDIIKKEITKISGNETKNIETTDKNGDRVVIPAGFIVDPNHNTVENGLVIIDKNAGDTNTVGNEFVWIPCMIDGKNDILQYDRYAFSRDGWEFNQKKLDEKDEDGSYKIIRTDTTNYFHEALPEEERASVEKYGGYYIGRYESGYDEERTISDSEYLTPIPKIKKDLRPYDYLTRNDAQRIAQKMYEGKNIKSKLCSSYAWDTALRFMDGDTGTYAVNSEGRKLFRKKRNKKYRMLCNKEYI